LATENTLVTYFLLTNILEYLSGVFECDSRVIEAKAGGARQGMLRVAGTSASPASGGGGKPTARALRCL